MYANTLPCMVAHVPYWQHTYRVEWRDGEDGFMRWELDGKLQFEVG